MSKDILPFPISAYPTAAEISLSLEARRAQVGRAKEPEPRFNEYIQEPGLEHGHPWPPELLSFVLPAGTATAHSALKPLGVQVMT